MYWGKGRNILDWPVQAKLIDKKITLLQKLFEFIKFILNKIQYIFK